VTNILGVSVKNYSGDANVLVRDSNDPANPSYLKSSSFGQARHDRRRRIRPGRTTAGPDCGPRDVLMTASTVARQLTLRDATPLIIG
jgi:hypothetical protein